MPEDKWADFWATVGLTCLIILMALIWTYVASVRPAHAQHRHEDMANHEKFYNTWTMPDNRAVSCCHDEDCRSAEAYMKDGRWYARQDGDQGDFTPIPPGKVEQDRDSPDGRSHLCGRRYGFNSGSFTVFCFVAGSGS